MKFQRTDAVRFSKLGKNRKKKQKWRAAKGRDNKIREKRKSYPREPNVGFKGKRSESGKINGKVPILAMNVKDLEKVGKDNVVIIARVGAKKRMEMIKKADEMKLKIININIKGGMK